MTGQGTFKKVTAFVFMWVFVFVVISNIIPQVKPSKELPKAITEVSVSSGKKLVLDRGCMVCHAIGSETGRAPDLANVGRLAGERKPDYDAMSYIVESLLGPQAYVVEGFPPTMPPADKPPATLSEDEIVSAVMYLQNLGGKPSKPEEIRRKMEEIKGSTGG